MGWLGTNIASSPTPIPVNTSGISNSNFSSVSLGMGHALALMTDGKVYSWGTNYYGALGDGVNGTIYTRTIPALVANISKPIVRISAGGYYFSIALCNDGSVYVWGNSQLSGADFNSSLYSVYIPVLLTSANFSGSVNTIA